MAPSMGLYESIQLGVFDGSIDGAKRMGLHKWEHLMAPSMEPFLSYWDGASIPWIQSMDTSNVKRMEPSMGSMKESHRWAIIARFIKLPHRWIHWKFKWWIYGWGIHRMDPIYGSIESKEDGTIDGIHQRIPSMLHQWIHRKFDGGMKEWSLWS